MKKAARRCRENAAADWLFLLPNLIVAEKGITGLPKNAISESFDLSSLAPVLSPAAMTRTQPWP